MKAQSALQPAIKMKDEMGLSCLSFTSFFLFKKKRERKEQCNILDKEGNSDYRDLFYFLLTRFWVASKGELVGKMNLSSLSHLRTMSI